MRAAFGDPYSAREGLTRRRRFKQVSATRERIAPPALEPVEQFVIESGDEDRSQRLLLVLVLDTTHTMAGEPLARMAASLTSLERALTADPELRAKVRIAFVTFGDGAVRAWRGAVVAPFGTTPFLEVWRFAAPALAAAGTGSTVAAVELAIDCVGEEKADLKRRGLSYYRPMIWLISDGVPTDSDRSADAWSRLAERIAADEQHRKFIFMTIGVGDAAGDDAMRTLAPRGHLRAEQMEWRQILQLVSASADRFDHRESVDEFYEQIEEFNAFDPLDP